MAAGLVASEDIQWVVRHLAGTREEHPEGNLASEDSLAGTALAAYRILAALGSPTQACRRLVADLDNQLADTKVVVRRHDAPRREPLRQLRELSRERNQSGVLPWRNLHK